MAKKQSQKVQFALCISSAEPDLEIRKVYRILPDDAAARSKYIRVIDESGDDYLYPVKYFVLVDVPVRARRALAAVE